MTQTQILLTDEAAEIIDREVKARGLAGPSEFNQSLVQQEQASPKEVMDLLIIQGLDSGPAFPLENAWREQRRRISIPQSNQVLPDRRTR